MAYKRNDYLQQVTVGTKQIPLVKPTPGLVLADRQAGGRYPIAHQSDLQPLIGIRFDTLASTGTSQISSGVAAGNLVAPAVALSGYTKVLKGGINPALSSLAAFNVGTGDYTLAVRILVNGTTPQYSAFFGVALGSGAALQIRLGDNGFGNILQICPNAKTFPGCMNVSGPTNRSTMYHVWTDVVMQRVSNKLTCYVNGALKNIQPSDGSQPVGAFQIDNSGLTGANSEIVLDSDLQLAEVAFWNKGVYSANYTPAVGSLF